ncbi:hypothetical protein KEC55_24815 [Burkholderia cepacia]|uniref:hypothetical protein n=1 Tax=Burkholderia cepacia TaxID=292 RepID=UPI00249E15B0|nr:hypothetical protein [Burkholderia cepacia]WGY70271.1 hypothetical protein KEC55_24815 [Burkholderia cepacia]
MKVHQSPIWLLLVGCCLLSAYGNVSAADAEYIGYTPTNRPAATDARTFVFVEINESIMPIERGHKYEDPLDDALKKGNLGEVTGGGSMLSKDHAVEWVGIDVELTDLDKGLPFLKQKLIELGVQDGMLEYRVQNRRFAVPIRDR